MKPALAVVGAERPEPPYPAETRRVSGWKFDLDPDRLLASDTWAIASAEARPWLLRLWFESWLSIPCGSLPNDDAVIAARIGMPLDRFRDHRSILLRGWREHADGLLYHPVLTEMVLGMAAQRAEFLVSRSEAARIAGKASAAARRAKYGTAQPNVPNVPNAPERRSERSVRTSAERPERPELTVTYTNTTTSSSPIGEEVSSAEPRTPARPVPDCPHEQVVALYHELLPANPKVREWTDARKALLRARWREMSVPKGKRTGYTTPAEGLAWWRMFFEFVAASDFLTGKAPSRDGRPFFADLEWLVRPQNFVKVYERRYHDRGQA